MCAHTPIHADMNPCKATSFVTTTQDLHGKGQSPWGAVHPACLSVSVTVVWSSNFCRQDDCFTGKKAVNNYKKSCFQMQKPPLSRNLRSKVLGGTPGLLAATKNEKTAGTIYCSEDLHPHRSPRDSMHGSSKHHQLLTSSTSSLWCGGFSSFSGWGCSEGLLLDEEVPTLSDLLLLEWEPCSTSHK